MNRIKLNFLDKILYGFYFQAGTSFSSTNSLIKTLFMHDKNSNRIIEINSELYNSGCVGLRFRHAIMATFISNAKNKHKI